MPNIPSILKRKIFHNSSLSVATSKTFCVYKNKAMGSDCITIMVFVAMKHSRSFKYLYEILQNFNFINKHRPPWVWLAIWAGKQMSASNPCLSWGWIDPESDSSPEITDQWRQGCLSEGKPNFSDQVYVWSRPS